jgi:hypothetical protein
LDGSIQSERAQAAQLAITAENQVQTQLSLVTAGFTTGYSKVAKLWLTQINQKNELKQNALKFGENNGNT